MSRICEKKHCRGNPFEAESVGRGCVWWYDSAHMDKRKHIFMKRFITSVFIFSYFFCMPRFSFAEEKLTWHSCIAEAQKNNPDLISAVETVNQNKAAKTIVASGLFPQIDATLNASTGKTRTTNSSGSTTSSTADSYSYGVSANQLVFDGFQTIHNVKAAGENIKASQQAYRFTSSEVRLSLRTAFVSLLRAQELINVTEEIVKIRRSNYELITLRYQSGLEHRGALLTAEANLDQANFEVAQAKREIELSQRELTKEMGRQEFKSMRIEGDFTVIDDAEKQPDLDVLAKNNPAVLQLAAKRNSAAYSIKSVYGSFFPHITGQAQAERSGAHWAPLNGQWNLGLGLTLPIFEGGLRIAQVTQAVSAYRQAQANERSGSDSALVNLAQAWVSLRDAVETVGVKRKNLEATLERSRIAEAQYSTGFITFDNWIIIENDLVQAKKDYLNAQANALLAEAQWIQAKGETLEYAQK